MMRSSTFCRIISLGLFAWSTAAYKGLYGSIGWADANTLAQASAEMQACAEIKATILFVGFLIIFCIGDAARTSENSRGKS